MMNEQFHVYIPVRNQYLMRRPISGLVNGVKINLLEDLDEFCVKKLNDQGVKRKDENDPTMDYFRFQRRLIDIRPRSVYKAKSFRCPEEYENKLNFLETRIIRGDNLNPFLTKNVINLNNEDMMLYDWDLYHFHISDTVGRQGTFMKRSDYLLIAYVSWNAVYFIDVVPHSEKNKAMLWANKKYLQIIKDNWPELISKYLVKGAALTKPIDEKTIYDSRRARALTFVALDDGSVYCLVGGGYASDGSSLRAVSQADHLRNLTGNVEYEVTKEFWLLIKQRPDLQCRVRENIPPYLKLIGTDSKKFILIEPNLNILISVEPHENDNTWEFGMADISEAYWVFCHGDDKFLTMQ